MKQLTKQLVDGAAVAGWALVWVVYGGLHFPGVPHWFVSVINTVVADTPGIIWLALKGWRVPLPPQELVQDLGGGENQPEYLDVPFQRPAAEAPAEIPVEWKDVWMKGFKAGMAAALKGAVTWTLSADGQTSYDVDGLKVTFKGTGKEVETEESVKIVED